MNQSDAGNPFSPSRREALRRSLQALLGATATLPLLDNRLFAGTLNAAGAVDAAAAGGTAGPTVAAVTSAAQAAGFLPDGILLEDSGSGVARDFYHYILKMPWRGSFSGVLMATPTAKGPGVIRAPLASYQEAVVITSNHLWVNVASRETATPPVLEVTYQDGTTGTLPCLADSTIDPSMTAPTGYTKVLSLGTAVLRFARPTKAVSTSTLVLTVTGSGANVVLQVSAFVSPVLPEPPVTYGLRSRGLSGPTLIHAVDFNQPNWYAPWFNYLSMMPKASTFDGFVVDKDGDTGQPLGRKSYCVVNGPVGTATGPNVPDVPSYIFPLHLGKELDEVYFQYRLRFGEGWRGGSMQSGKLPGIASDTTIAGNGGATSNGTNGWSFRGLFVGEPLAADSPYNSNNGLVPIGWYTYNPDQVALHEFYGLHLPWTGRGSLGVLEVGKDYWIDQYIKVNTPGKKDGIVRAWINGQLAYERTDHVMRGLPPYQIAGNLAINKIWMTFLHGGDRYPLPTKVLRTYWSDWTIATEYIGPPKSGGNAAPSVNITSPVSGTSFTPGSAVTVAATASDSDGSISKVDFYRDGTLVATSASAPYTATLSGLTAGTHVLTAVATDNAGVTGGSAPVTITIGSGANAAPTVSVTSPASGASFVAGTAIPVTATAADKDGSIAKVMLYVDGTVFASIVGVSPPYTASVSNLAVGSHTITAVATDNTGATTTSAPVTIQVAAAGNATTVTLQDGANGYASTRDTYISAWYTSENNGSKALLLESGNYVDLVRFAVFQSEGGPVPNGAVITSAQLGLYKTTDYNYTYEARRMLVDWVQGEATWKRARAGANWAAPGAAGAGTDFASTVDATGTVAYAPGWLTFDVTAALQAMAGGQANHGWRLKRVSGNSNEKRFASSRHATRTLRPKLVISYR